MKKLLLLPLALLALVVPAAHAAVLFDYDGGVAVASRSDGPNTIGNLFLVGSSDLLVTQLGVMDVNNANLSNGSNGFAGDNSIQVAIWKIDGSVVTSTNVLGTSTLGADGYRYVTLTTAITLDANTQYLIGAFVGSGQEYYLDDHPNSPFTADTSYITLQDSRYLGGSFGAPTSTGPTVGRWAPANAVFTAVPEPSAALLGGLGVLALLRRRR